MNIRERINRFAPFEIDVDLGHLSHWESEVLDRLLEAAKFVDEIFWEQVWDGNKRLKSQFSRSENPERDYFNLNFGPFDRLCNDEPFIDGIGAKPKGANFYPSNLTTDEFVKFLEQHPDDKELFESPYTIIRRDGAGLKAIPYNKAYDDQIAKISTLLMEAASFSNESSIGEFLSLRAKDLISNEYFKSECSWVKTKGSNLEVVIGPYEVYEDKLFSYKASFEAYITIVDPQETGRLSKIENFIAEMEQNLPVENKYKGIGRNLNAPIVVANELFNAGEAKAGIQALAFNLPNDERVKRVAGSKKVLLKNIHRAKFEKILKPIASKVLRLEDQNLLDFEAFFAHVLLHEVSHGIGPGEIVKNCKPTTVNKELKECHSTMEECKADVLSVHNVLLLIEKGLYEAGFDRHLFATFIPNLFRSLRFGLGSAHACSNMIQLNFLRETGGIILNENENRFAIKPNPFRAGIEKLSNRLLILQAKGDYEGAKEFISRYTKIPRDIEEMINVLKDIPIDIRPIFKRG